LVTQRTDEAGVSETQDKDVRQVAPNLRVDIVHVLPAAVAALAFGVLKRQVEDLVALGATDELNFGSP